MALPRLFQLGGCRCNFILTEHLHFARDEAKEGLFLFCVLFGPVTLGPYCSVDGFFIGGVKVGFTRLSQVSYC